MEKLYIVTLWSGGKPGKKWLTAEGPRLLTEGNGIEFKSLDTGLMVQLIGNVSVEEYEHGSENPEHDGCISSTSTGLLTAKRHRQSS